MKRVADRLRPPLNFTLLQPASRFRNSPMDTEKDENRLTPAVEAIQRPARLVVSRRADLVAEGDGRFKSEAVVALP